VGVVLGVLVLLVLIVAAAFLYVRFRQPKTYRVL
jgi:hypothetical protein